MTTASTTTLSRMPTGMALLGAKMTAGGATLAMSTPAAIVGVIMSSRTSKSIVTRFEPQSAAVCTNSAMVRRLLSFWLVSPGQMNYLGVPTTTGSIPTAIRYQALQDFQVIGSYGSAIR